jgi:hypothetical protein
MPNAFATPSPHVVQATLEEEPVEPEPPAYAGEYQPPDYQPPDYQSTEYEAEYEAYEPPALGPDRLRAARPACWTDLDGPPAGGAWIRQPRQDQPERRPEAPPEQEDPDG